MPCHLQRPWLEILCFYVVCLFLHMSLYQSIHDFLSCEGDISKHFEDIWQKLNINIHLGSRVNGFCWLKVTLTCLSHSHLRYISEMPGHLAQMSSWTLLLITRPTYLNRNVIDRQRHTVLYIYTNKVLLHSFKHDD